MASITARNGRYLARVRRQGHPTVTKTFSRKSDAQAWARRLEADMEAGRWAPESAAGPTFRQAVAEYRQRVVPRMKGASTYRYRFDEFERLPWADRPLSDIQARHLAAWRDDQLHRLKPSTVVRKLAMLSAVFAWAIRERGWIERNPLSLVARPQVRDERDRTLTALEVTWLMRAARTSKARWLAASLTVLMTTAMRRGELCALRRNDLDLEARIARLRDTKNGRPRDVPLSPQALAALSELDSMAEARGDQALIPLGPPGSFSTRFKVTVDRAIALYEADCASRTEAPTPRFLSDLRLHDLRHHAVSVLASTGVLSLQELMAVSGHRTTQMLMRYTHLQPRKIAEKLARLE